MLSGVKHCDEFTYDRKLSELVLKYPNTVKFLPTFRRPDETRNSGWAGTKSRVNSIFERYTGNFNLPKDDTIIYACGYPCMIVDPKEKADLDGWSIIEEHF